jgi:hypothetical protein
MISVFVFALLFTFSSLALAETDVTSKVQLIKSALTYDTRTATSSLNISLKNISQETILTPITVVVVGISDANVRLSNAEGTTVDGKPFIQYTYPLLSAGQIDPGGTCETKMFKFNNPRRARFTFTVQVLGLAPVPDSTINRASEALESRNLDSFLLNVSASDQRSMKAKLAQFQDVMAALAQDIRRGSPIANDGQYITFETTIEVYGVSGGITVNFWMVFENGAWRLVGL